MASASAPRPPYLNLIHGNARPGRPGSGYSVLHTFSEAAAFSDLTYFVARGPATLSGGSVGSVGSVGCQHPRTPAQCQVTDLSSPRHWAARCARAAVQPSIALATAGAITLGRTRGDGNLNFVFRAAQPPSNTSTVHFNTDTYCRPGRTRPEDDVSSEAGLWHGRLVLEGQVGVERL